MLKRIAAGATLIITGVVIALLLVEAALRTFLPNSAFGTGKKLKYMREVDVKKDWAIDPEFGFRPVLGNDNYNEYGTKVNSYGIAKRPGVRRLVFMGDSVTARGRIIDGLRRFYGEDKFEYWNAGVESFNLVQEAGFYKKYNRPLKPDDVILTFHLNDFETTPVVFVNKKNKLMVYTPKIPAGRINNFLFKNSCLYRLYLGCLIGLRSAIANPKKEIEAEVAAKMRELRDLLGPDGARLTVLVLPSLRPYEEWTAAEKGSRAKISKILNELGIRYFDLYNALGRAIKDGIGMRSDPGDYAHPSDKMGLYFAKYLYQNSLLEE